MWLHLLSLLFSAITQEPATEKLELALLSQSLNKMLVEKAPREIEDRTNWNKTVPLEPNLKLMSLRTVLKVNDRDELAHGSWSRSKVTFADLAKDVQIHVREMKPIGGGKQRLKLEVDARFAWEHERKVYAKGFSVAGLTAAGTSRGIANLTCEISTKLETNVFPPTLKVEVVVVENTLELREFELTKLTNLPLISAQAKKLSDEIRPLVQLALTYKEKDLTPVLNAALGEALKKR